VTKDKTRFGSCSTLVHVQVTAADCWKRGQQMMIMYIE
jgi:hypothetical protein